MTTIDSLSSVLRSHQRFMAKLLVEVVSRKEESGALMDSFSEVLRSSEEIMDGMTDAEAATELTTYKEVHRVAREKESAKLVEGSSRLLGTLSLHPDMKCDDIGFVKADLKGEGKLELVEDDLRNVFSSTCFPRMLNEDEYFNTLQIGYLGMGETEEGVPAQLRKELFLLLDWPRLSHSSKEEVKSQFDNTSWGAEILRELEDSNNWGTVKRTYKWPRYERVVTAEELRTSHLRTRIDILFAQNPDMLCVLDASEYINHKGTLSSDCVKMLPSCIRRLSFTNCGRCIAFEKQFREKQEFLSDSCDSLTSIDFTAFHNVTAIPSKFLYNSKSLTSVDLSSLSEVTSIGDYFICHCESLTSIDVSSLKKLTEIGHGFLHNSKSLTSVDLSSLSEVTSVGDHFIGDCDSLTSIDVSGLKKLTTIGGGFLLCSKSLTSVDLSSLSEVTSVGDHFISYCESLTSIDVSGLKKLTTIGGGFLRNSKSLTSVDLSSLSEVTSVGNNFISDCESLTSIDVSGLKKLTEIGHGFLHNSKSLTSVDLSSLSEVTSIGYYFISNCESLTSIDVSGFRKVTTTGGDLLWNTKLTKKDVKGLEDCSFSVRLR